MVLKEIGKRLKKAKKILLLGHQRPDGDTIGALLSFYLILKRQGKEVFPTLKDKPSLKFSFLPSFSEIRNELPESYDLSLALDVSDLKLLGFKIRPEINIDHHLTNSNFAEVNLVKPEKSATCEILFDLFEKLGFGIDKDLSTCLLTGIFTDTASFQNQNTTGECLKVASRLLSFGARLSQINKNVLNAHSLSSLKLLGKALERLWENKKLGLVITLISRADLKKLKAVPEDLEGLANFLNTIPKVKAILVLSEEDGEIKGSLRTRNDEVDVSRLAQLFGGGGHQKAAGFSLRGRLKYKAGRWFVV